MAIILWFSLSGEAPKSANVRDFGAIVVNRHQNQELPHILSQRASNERELGLKLHEALESFGSACTGTAGFLWPEFRGGSPEC